MRTSDWQRQGKRDRVVRLVLGVWAAGLVWFLLAARKPWETRWAERLAEGKVPGFKDYLATGFWWGAVVDLAIVIAVLAASFWWLRLPEPGRLNFRGGTNRPGVAARWFWGLLAAAVVAGFFPRLARMDDSFWGDEAWAVGSYVHGYQEPVADGPEGLQGELATREVTWAHTFFDDRGGGNNHTLFSVLARLSSGVWHGLTGAPPDAFSEAAIRVPSLIAGLATIVAFGLFLRWAGFPVAGLVAAWVLALHPWHVRYSSEARGYALFLFFFVLSLWALAAAAGSGRWRDWAVFAACEFLALYSWNGAVYPLAAANGIAVVGLLFSRRAAPPAAPGGTLATRGRLPARPERVSAVVRLALANAAVALLFIELFAPCQPQIVHHLQRTVGMAGGLPEAAWWAELGGHLLAGTQLVARPWGLPVDYSLESLWGGRGWAAWSVLGVAVAAATAGLVAAGRESKWFALLAAAPLYAVLFCVVHFGLVLQARVICWYAFYLLVPAVFGWALAADAIAARLRAGGGAGLAFNGWLWRRDHAWVAAPAAAVVLFAATVAAPLHTVTTLPVERLREAFAVTRGRHEPLWQNGESSVRTIYLWRHAKIYDPRAETHVRDGQSLLEHAVAARAAGDELYVVIGNLMWVRHDQPDVLEVLEQSGEFELVEEFWTNHPTMSLKAYHLLPESGAAVVERVGEDRRGARG